MGTIRSIWSVTYSTANSGVRRSDVTMCRRGKAWGVANAKVTFANDGSVGQVVVGPPFAGAPTGLCVTDTMSAVQVPTFGGDPAVFVAQFYVAPR